MRITDSYPLLPNVCYYCRTATFPGVDLQRDDDDNPNRMERIYLCHKCLIHTARQISPRVGLSIIADAELHAIRADALAVREERDTALQVAEKAIAARDAILESWKDSLNIAPATPTVADIETEPETVPDQPERRRPGRPRKQEVPF